jgi:hypothetical protein
MSFLPVTSLSFDPISYLPLPFLVGLPAASEASIFMILRSCISKPKIKAWSSGIGKDVI